MGQGGGWAWASEKGACDRTAFTIQTFCKIWEKCGGDFDLNAVPDDSLVNDGSSGLCVIVH